MALTKTYRIGVQETDPWGRCRPSALLGMLQDMAMADSEQLGLGAPDLLRLCGGHWILARLRYTLNRPLEAGQHPEIWTDHRGAKGALIYRDAVITVAGEAVGRAVSAWVVGDLVTRKMLWPNALPDRLRQAAGEGETLRRFRLPDNMEPAFAHRTRYSDTDENGHMNNTRYADLCCDALTPEELETHWVQTLELSYLKECLQGQTVQVERAAQADTRYLRGVLDGETSFEARLELA